MDNKIQFTHLAGALMALSIVEYYGTPTQKFLDRIAVYTKILIFQIILGKLHTTEIVQSIQHAFQSLLNTLRNMGQSILLVTTNMCFGLVIIFLILKYVLQNIHIYEPKYYTLTLF